MEAALVRALVTTLMPKLFTLVQEKYKLRERTKDDIAFINKELGMIVSAIEDYSRSSRSKDLGAVSRSWIEEVRDLAHEIEDCVDRFLYDHAAHGPLRRSPARFASEIRALKEKSNQAYQRRQRYAGGGDGQGSTSAGSSTSSAPADPLVLEADLVGMAEPRRELLELVQDPVEKLKVISVVGFGGLGKTLLARQVYESDVAKQFSPRAWVRAADKGAEEVLMEVLKEIRKQTGTQQGDASDVEVELLNMHLTEHLHNKRGDASDVEVEQLSKHLREHLHNKRYFIVIDDMRTEQWGTIEPAFPADNGVSSRIMVTTNLHTIANACSSESGYVYKMSTLDAKCSEDLFFNSACCKERSPNMESGSAALLKKCDGLPLALVSVGQFLRSKGSLTGTTCQDLCAKLGYHLEKKDETLSRMHRVLTHNYTCLSGHAAKACLLYLGMFPSNHRIRRKTLIRRWLAEGLVVTQPGCSAFDVAAENFETLRDRNIIQPIDVCNNEHVKTCQPPGMMLEFIMHKSVSEKFITLLCDKTPLPNARRLSLHHNSATSVGPDNDLSLVRSLTIFGEAGQDILDFRKYQLLRVLDLEECKDLTDRHLKGICNLLLLRYLSLGETITTLPRKISKLKFLETLDVRRTMVEVLLPIELIVLPNLIHLFGKFKLLDEVSSKIQNFFVSGKSNLETLAGFVTNENQGLLQLMGDMKKLKKVKIWCESTGDSSDLNDLSRPIKEYIQDGTGTNDARSLSLDFEKCSKDFVQFSLPEYCHLSSLKLHGELHKMPPFVTSLCDLRELCLSLTNNLSGDLLPVLSTLHDLCFLKLAADRLENFVITDGAFPKLKRLCFVVQSSTLPVICDGALPQLLSLHLLYKNLDGLHAIKIECIKRLKEVKIDYKVNAETRKTWEDAAKKHPNRPKILFMEKDHPMEVRPTENSVVPERLPMEVRPTENSVVPERHPMEVRPTERPSSKNSSRWLFKTLAGIVSTSENKKRTLKNKEGFRSSAVKKRWQSLYSHQVPTTN